MKQTVVDDEAVVFECELPEPRDKVWRALTERELLARWLSPNDLRPEVGTRFQLRPATAPATISTAPTLVAGSTPAAGPTAVRSADAAPTGAPPAPAPRAAIATAVDCEVLAVDPGRTLSWRQRERADAVYVESIVRFDLTDLPDGGTHLRIIHNGFTTVAREGTAVARKPTVVNFSRRTTRTKCTITSCLLRKAA